jgi:hypothetical protein
MVAYFVTLFKNKNNNVILGVSGEFLFFFFKSGGLWVFKHQLHVNILKVVNKFK